MNELIREKCDLLAGNCSAIHKKFLLEAKLMSVASGMIFTSADREADTAKMKECRKLLEKKTGILSNYRQTTELMILSKMALSDDP